MESRFCVPSCTLSVSLPADVVWLGREDDRGVRRASARPWVWIVLPVMLLTPPLVACDGVSEGGADPEPLKVRVRGFEYQWYVSYPGRDEILGTRDDVVGMRDLHVPVDTQIEIDLESDDYIYGFRIPDFEVNQVAVPELHFSTEFTAESIGTHLLKGDQMCGFKHPSLLGRVVVYSRSEYADWVARQSP